MERRKIRTDRRKQTLNSLVHGSFRPRRRDNRRGADDQVMILDWHDTPLFCIAMGIVLMSCMDALFTLNLLALGAEELNLAMKVLLDMDTGSFLLGKYCATAVGVVFLVAVSRFRLWGVLPVRRILEALCIGYAMLMIYELYLLVAVASDIIF